MARILLLLLLFVMVKSSHEDKPQFPKVIEKVACSLDSELMRIEITEQTNCGAPKDVFIYLEGLAAYQQGSPTAMWVKRCVGLCDDHINASNCVPIKTRIKNIPLRIFDVTKNKEACATYPLEEHESCGCCAGTPDSCKMLQVNDPQRRASGGSWANRILELLGDYRTRQADDIDRKADF